MNQVRKGLALTSGAIALGAFALWSGTRQDHVDERKANRIMARTTTSTTFPVPTTIPTTDLTFLHLPQEAVPDEISNVMELFKQDMKDYCHKISPRLKVVVFAEQALGEYIISAQCGQA